MVTNGPFPVLAIRRCHVRAREALPEPGWLGGHLPESSSRTAVSRARPASGCCAPWAEWTPRNLPPTSGGSCPPRGGTPRSKPSWWTQAHGWRRRRGGSTWCGGGCGGTLGPIFEEALFPERLARAVHLMVLGRLVLPRSKRATYAWAGTCTRRGSVPSPRSPGREEGDSRAELVRLPSGPVPRRTWKGRIRNCWRRSGTHGTSGRIAGNWPWGCCPGTGAGSVLVFPGNTQTRRRAGR
jgi:hypothetical protein